MSAHKKAIERFRGILKGGQIGSGEVFFMSTAQISGKTIPSGIIIFDTTAKKLKLGVGSTTPETVTSA